VLGVRTNLLTRNAYLAMWGSNRLDSAPYMAHAMHSLLDVKRHALALALSFLATGILALDACNFSPAPIMRLDTKTGFPSAFAGSGLIASFAVDAAGIYWVRDGNLLLSALK
jgi:hypothetical protein